MNKCKSKDDTDIYYEVLGDGDITLCFVSGAGGILEHWELQHSFGEKYKLILPDLGGHGKSAKTKRCITIGCCTILYADAVLQAEDLHKIILIGWSMGGPIILEAERILKDRVIGVIGIDTFFPYPGSLYTENSKDETELIMDDFRGDTRNKIITMYIKIMNKGIKVSEEIQKELLQFPIIKSEVFLSELEELCYWDIMPFLENLQIPIKAIVGGLSEPSETQREIFKLKIDTIFMEGYGHNLFWAGHESFNHNLQQMISEILSNAKLNE